MADIKIQTTQPTDAPAPFGTDSFEAAFKNLERRMEQIRQRAYDLYCQRGGEHGHDQDDWFTAENELAGMSQAEITEQKGACHVRLALPGFEARNVTVTAMPQAILVEAVREEHSEPPRESGAVELTWSTSAEVFRKIDLPRTADLDRVTASLEDGVLTVDAPYAGASQSAEKNRPEQKISKPYPEGIKIAVA